jgi:ParB family transcriptional regulator, chromosome partitioning protein
VSRRAGIGRGLAAILPEAEAGADELREIPVELIRPNPDQPRKSFDSDALERLADSLREAGVVQPLVVHQLADGRYELIAGERRWRAARLAGLEAVPAVLRSAGEGQRMSMALIENMAREDLNPVEAARACAALVEELDLTKEEVARRVGRSRSSISNLIRILDLPDPALELLASGELSEGHGRALLQVKGQDARRRLAREAARRGWSVRETERRAKRAAAPPRREKVTPHPDQQAALDRAEDALGGALGREVRVTAARRGLRAEVHFDDLDELLGLASSIRRRRD